jgi:hypothetical protein
MFKVGDYVTCYDYQNPKTVYGTGYITEIRDDIYSCSGGKLIDFIVEEAGRWKVGTQGTTIDERYFRHADNSDDTTLEDWI